jgi:hypothetical protein
MLWKRIALRDQERALVARNGRFHKILTHGEHRILTLPGMSVELEKHNILHLAFKSKWSNYLVRERPDIIERYFTLVETNEFQIAMVHANGELFRIVTPAKRMLFWRDVAKITVELIEVITGPTISQGNLLRLEHLIGSP